MPLCWLHVNTQENRVKDNSKSIEKSRNRKSHCWSPSKASPRSQCFIVKMNPPHQNRYKTNPDISTCLPLLHIKSVWKKVLIEHNLPQNHHNDQTSPELDSERHFHSINPFIISSKSYQNLDETDPSLHIVGQNAYHPPITQTHPNFFPVEKIHLLKYFVFFYYVNKPFTHLQSNSFSNIELDSNI